MLSLSESIHPHMRRNSDSLYVTITERKTSYRPIVIMLENTFYVKNFDFFFQKYFNSVSQELTKVNIRGCGVTSLPVGC